MAKSIRNNPDTALPLDPIKQQVSRFHPKHYLARINIGVPARTITFPRKCKTKTEAEAWAIEIIARIRGQYAKNA